MMELKILRYRLKTSPYIEFSEKYFYLKNNGMANILSLSGFGWNSKKSIVVCDKSV